MYTHIKNYVGDVRRLQRKILSNYRRLTPISVQIRYPIRYRTDPIWENPIPGNKCIYLKYDHGRVHVHVEIRDRVRDHIGVMFVFGFVFMLVLMVRDRVCIQVDVGIFVIGLVFMFKIVVGIVIGLMIILQ